MEASLTIILTTAGADTGFSKVGGGVLFEKSNYIVVMIRKCLFDHLHLS